MADALRHLQAWPELQQAWKIYAGLWYPEHFYAITDSASIETQASQYASSTHEVPATLLTWQQFLFPEQSARISVCMIVRDEARVLKQALDSVADISHEIIVVDTGSVDQSPQIARSYARVRWFSQAWQDDFSIARNFSLQQVQGDWVFVLDADEVLDLAAQDYLKRLLRYAPLGWQVAAVQIKHQLASDTALSWAPRVFRAQPKEIRYSGALHELPVKQSSVPFLLTLFLPICLWHSGSQREAQLIHQKSRRLQILEKMIADPQRVNPYARYHYGYVLFHGIDTPQNLTLAEQLFEQALQESLVYRGRLAPHPDWLPAPLPGVLMALAQVYLSQERWSDVLALYSRFGKLCPYSSFSMLAAQAAQASKNYGLARQLLLHTYAPALYQLQASDRWQSTVLQTLLELCLQAKEGLWALFAVRRLLELNPLEQTDAQAPDLWKLHADLHQHLTIPIGAWLDRLFFEWEHAENPYLRLLFAWWILCESWSPEALLQALQSAQALEAGVLVNSLLKLGQSWYGAAFGLHFVDPNSQAKTAAAVQADFESAYGLPGGAYWHYLLTPPLQAPRISLCMIVRNGAERILAALESVAGLVDEYIIADTGSEDQTVALIQVWSQDHAVTLLHLQWRDDFAWARNQTLAAASGDWIFVLDADEALSPESIPALKRILAYRPQGLPVMTLACESYFDDPRRNNRVPVARIFARHDLIRFEGRIHERLCHARLNENLAVNNLVGVTLKHWGYLEAEMLKHRKLERSHLLAESLQVQGLLNPYYLYHYGYVLLHESEAVASQRERGVAYLLKSIELSETQILPPVRGWFRAPVARVKLLLFRYWFQQEALAELMHYYPLWKKQVLDAEFHYLFGSTALQLGEFRAAQAAFLTCLKSDSASRFGLPFRDILPLQGLIQLALKTGNWALGIGAFQHWIALNLDAQRDYANWWQAMLRASQRPQVNRGSNDSEST